ncbi:hypothetical protein [Culicoidibacter larvae]|uniref:Uncharacterized protein n=1 Tax=Culicoidibacter larvae TaxID=2579976 RepID=A0A5R8QFZ3_9FIRM|nr:hypothetical protein [Culicoidibacter larvae]TLG76676.1 hypothetical protein FEZ08_03420 [Culicoidibacter larvae]
MKNYLKWMLYKYSPAIKYTGIGLLIVLSLEVIMCVLGNYFETIKVVALLFSSLSSLLFTGIYIAVPILFMVNQAFGKGLEQVLVVPISRYKVLLAQVIFGVVLQTTLTVVMVLGMMPMMFLLQTISPMTNEVISFGTVLTIVVMSVFSMINGITTWQFLFYGSQIRAARRIPMWLRALIIVVAYFIIVFAFELSLQQFGISSFQAGFQAGMQMAGADGLMEGVASNLGFSQLTLVLYLGALSLLSIGEFTMARYFLKHKVEM